MQQQLPTTQQQQIQDSQEQIKPYIEAIYDQLKESKEKQYLKTEITNNTLYITLNRPRRMNSFTLGMFLHMTEILNNSAQNEEIKVTVIQGTGKMFSSGNDLANFQLMADIEDQAIYEKINYHIMLQIVFPFQKALILYNKPLIALVDGGAIGFAFTMLGLFDYVLITKKSFFEAPLVALAQSPELGSSLTFPKIFGKTKAFDILVRGQRQTGQEISKTRLITKSFETSEQLKQYSQKLVSDLLELDSLAVQNAKKLLNKQDTKLLLENSEQECQNQAFLCSRKEEIQQAVFKRMSKPKSKL